MFPQKKEQILLYHYETSGWLVFVCFLEEIEDTKETFSRFVLEMGQIFVIYNSVSLVVEI